MEKAASHAKLVDRLRKPAFVATALLIGLIFALQFLASDEASKNLFLILGAAATAASVLLVALKYK